MFLKGAFPPRNLTLLIAAMTAVPLATLLWLGWRLIEQDRMLEAQRMQERTEHAADLIISALQRALASSEQRLVSASEDWPEGAVVVDFRPNGAESYPKQRIAFLPYVPPLRAAPPAVFTAGEELEFRQHDYMAAVRFFRNLARSADEATRAGALLRLGRNLAHAGRVDEALVAYEALSLLDDVGIDGTPAGLIGRYKRCELLKQTNRSANFHAEVERFAAELASGRWALTAPIYGLYARDAATWRGTDPATRSQPELFAEAAALIWARRQSLPAAGRESLLINGQTPIVLWHSSGGDTFRVLVASPAFAQANWLAAADSIASEQHVAFQVDGFGANADRTLVKRTTKQTELPWNLTFSPGSPAEGSGEFVLRRRLLIAGFTVLVLMAFAAGYLIMRAVSHELAVVRLQSEFVGAVSHEFRTPLTALRQFTDMLRDNEAFALDPGKDRRLLCYNALSRATDRLTKLVESLLDFGRIEAGARRYQFERHECTAFVRQIVEDFLGSPQAAGFNVEFSGNGSVSIDADSEALPRAIWNLLDNAVKYSPDHRTVEVHVHRNGEQVLIDIRDYGIGIPAHEQDQIFSKFQRGEQARIRGIHGTGIGLSIVDEIVKAHRGHVEVKSEPDKGSTFTIVLPVKD